MMLAPCVPKKPVIKWPRTPPNLTTNAKRIGGAEVLVVREVHADEI